MQRRLTVPVILALSLALSGVPASGQGGGPPATGAFSPTGSLAATRVGESATALLDGRVLIVGGFGDDDVLESAEVWDPATDLFGPT